MVTNKKAPAQEITSKIVSDEAILKISKEIAVKFIEVGRITPATFPATFTSIYTTINHTVRKTGDD